VIVAGDAAGLLEPWTREGISFALRSGALAGEYAAKAATAGDRAATEASLGGYVDAVNAVLVPDMRAGRLLLTAFVKHPGAFHRGLSTAKGWGVFKKFCRSEQTFSDLVRHPAARLAMSLIGRL
jgi:flavin-dependent dehydrogenase